MWHLFSNRTGHSVPLGRHFFIQVLFRMCISTVSASAELHRGDPLGQNKSLLIPRPTFTDWAGSLRGRRKQYSLCHSQDKWSAQVKCTYKVHLHLVVMITGPAALLTGKIEIEAQSQQQEWPTADPWLTFVCHCTVDGIILQGIKRCWLIPPETTVRQCLPGQ